MFHTVLLIPHPTVIPTYLLSQLDARQHVCWNIMQDSPYQTWGTWPLITKK